MKKSDLVIATISLARTDEEEVALRTSLKALAALQLPVFLTDGGSSDDFTNYVKSLQGFTVFQAKGLWAQAGNSINEAAKAGAKWIFYTEPDKQMFFSTQLANMIETVAPKESTGVVLASRSANGFATFPPFQQMTETTINNCCKEIIGKDADFCYGPFLLNAKLVSYLDALPENCGWGWRPFLFAAAHRLGYEVESFVDDFVCPPEQRNDDEKERTYRMKQLTQNIEGLILATSIAY